MKKYRYSDHLIEVDETKSNVRLVLNHFLERVCSEDFRLEDTEMTPSRLRILTCCLDTYDMDEVVQNRVYWFTVGAYYGGAEGCVYYVDDDILAIFGKIGEKPRRDIINLEA